jgi:hypothetical protein
MHAKFAAASGRNLPGNGQPETHTRLTTSPGIPRPVKRFQHVWQVLGRNTSTRIFHGEINHFGVGIKADLLLVFDN